MPFQGRREDPRLLTGHGTYTADRSLPGQLHAHFLRSDRPHAEILAIDPARARALPGVAAVLTGADIAAAGFGAVPNLLRAPGRGGMALHTPPRDALARRFVRHVGQEVALVVAETAALAADAAELIDIRYRDLPAVTEAAAALRPDAPLLHAEVPGNLAYAFEYGDAAATDAAFATAAHIARVTLDSQRVAGSPMEPKACLAAFDPATGVYELFMPTQGMSMMRGALAAVTGLPPERLRVHAQDVGGGFGVRSEAYPEFQALLLATRLLGRPVKWVGTRAETMASDYHGRAATLTGALALDAEGRFLGLRIAWQVNVGAFCSHAGPFINSAANVATAAGVYRIGAVHGTHLLALTNTTPTTAYRGAGRPNVSYLLERLVDEAARVAGLDRIALRQRNMIPRTAFPYRTATGGLYDSGDPPGLLEKALAAAEWDGFAARRAAAQARGRLRGIGCAVFIEPSGGAAVREEVAIRFVGAGRVELFALCGPSGQGHETVFPEIVGDLLGIDPEKIVLRAGDPDGPPLTGLGTIGSRSLMNHGGALVTAARSVIRKGLDLAAQALEAAPADIVFAAGQYRVAGTDLAIGLEELVRRHARPDTNDAGAHPLDTTDGIDGMMAFPSGAHVAEVEIDPETGVVRLERYVCVDDCGRVLNETLVAGQMHGGVMQGVGQVLGEHCRYDSETGQLLTATFMDYAMPRADWLPALELHHHSVPSPTNPLGAKGAGEAGATGSLPAMANAVLDALRELGILHLDLPFTPARVWGAIAASRVQR